MPSHSKITGRGTGPLTVKGRWACVHFYDQLRSYGAVGRLLAVSPETVKKWVTRHLETGNVDELPRVGEQVCEVILPFFSNMPQRLAAVRANNGGRTNY